MRILVIEDEEKISKFIKRGLKEEGYAVDIASDGEEGHFMIGSNDYDLIILDLMLPKLDGLSLCRQLRSEKVNVPILILSAKDAVKDKVTGLNAGADDYLAKPFAFEELLARVRVLLRKKDANVPTQMQVGDLMMDLLDHTVKRAGKEIPLTIKEYALLEYLMRHEDAIVTRTMISEHVWDISFDTFTNVIDVYINYLRNKVDSSFDHKMIHTIRGKGYMIKK